MSEHDMPVEQDTPVWTRFTALIPVEFRTAGWTLWAVGNGPTLFGAQRYVAVLLKDLDAPDGTRAVGDGASEEEAVRAAKREPITRPVFVWLEIAAQLSRHGDGSLAAAIQWAMDRRRLGDNATFALTVEEQLRVNAVLQDWRGEHDPD